MKRLTLLGSTGSIGVNALDVIREHPDRFQIFALTAGRNIELLAKQVVAFRPKLAVVLDREGAKELKERLGAWRLDAQRLDAETGDLRIAFGPEAIMEAAASTEVDWVLSAIVGTAGLRPTYAALKSGKTVALANKESLVAAGPVMKRVEEGHLLPVDSEHSAIHQVLRSGKNGFSKIILTASGGPFRDKTLSELETVTKAEALRHPNWNMGQKITIDSATMMNKGLELIEAHFLFDTPPEKIDIVVHPQSIIHSMVSYVDGSTLAQMGEPDMRTPIAYALGFPDRIAAKVQPLDLTQHPTLTFEKPDSLRFPALRLARQALQAGGSAPCVLNAANETAVAAFLEERICFLEIARTIEKVLERHSVHPLNSVEEVLEVDRATRITTGELLK